MGRLNGLNAHQRTVDVISELRHHDVLRQHRLQERLNLTDPFSVRRVGGLDGISYPTGRREVLQRGAEYLVLPRLVARE